MKCKRNAALAAALVGLLLTSAASARADLADGYALRNLPVNVEGQFTAYAGQIHYWTAGSGYRIYDVSSDTTTSIGLPPNGTNTNHYGDSFGVLDPVNQKFYAATLYGASDSDVYTYDLAGRTWITPGPNGVCMANAYGGQVYNGRLYVSGLAEPWNGGYGQDTYIFAFDSSATAGGTDPRHDMLIQTSGNSANLAVAPNGDVYYGAFSPDGVNQLFRWTASQVASATDDLYASSAVDHFLTLADASVVCTLPGGGNGLAIDSAGHVFFTVNGFDADYNLRSVLAMVDPAAPSGYQEIYTSGDYTNWFGPISVDGDFLNGGALYFSPSTFGGNSLLEITAIPEPTTLILLALGGAGAAFRRRRGAE